MSCDKIVGTKAWRFDQSEWNDYKHQLCGFSVYVLYHRNGGKLLLHLKLKRVI